MRDSALKEVIVGNVEDESWKQAETDGFAVHSIKEEQETIQKLGLKEGINAGRSKL